MSLELSLASASPPAGGGGGLAQPPPLAPPGKEQQVAGVGILLQISMLVLSFVLGHVLRRHRFYYLPEASASLLIGTYICNATPCLTYLLSPWPLLRRVNLEARSRNGTRVLVQGSRMVEGIDHFCAPAVQH